MSGHGWIHKHDPRPLTFLQSLTLILFAGLLFRFALFNFVPINYDSGLYLYDAQRIFQGETPIVDYYSRSPLFHYFLAGALILIDDPLVAGRLLMILTSLGVGTAICILVSLLHSKRAGLFAAGFYVLTPLTMVWGQWVKTEQVATLISLLALIVLLPRIDADKIQLRYGALFGAILGVGFLIRRVVVVHAVVVAIFLLLYRYHTYQERIQPVALIAVAAGSMISIILAGYVMLAEGNPSTVIYLTNSHFLKLFPFSWELSGGSNNSVINASIFDLLLFFCNNCSIRTVNVTVEIAIVTFPTLLFTWVYFRGLISEGLDNINRRVQVGMLALGATMFVIVTFNHPAAFRHIFLGIYLLLGLLFVWLFTPPLTKVFDFDMPESLESHPQRDISILEVVSLLFILFAWLGMGFARLNYYQTTRTLIVIGGLALAGTLFIVSTRLLPRLSNQEADSPALALISILLFGIWLSYLARDRVVFVGYFQDVMSFLSILSGVAVTSIYNQLSEKDIRKFILTGIFVIALVSSLFAAPYINAGNGGIQQPYTGDGQVTTIQTIGDDLNKRTAPNETVFTAQPLYALEADRPNAANFSRMYWYFVVHPNSNASNATAEEIITSLESGGVEYVIIEQRMRTVFSNRPDIEAEFREHFCPVAESDPIYSPAGARLHKRVDRAPNCSG